VLDGQPYDLKAEPQGYFAGEVAAASAGSLYRFKLDNDNHLYPDPESRFQPEGPHGPSQVIDPTAFHWTDDNWKGIEPQGQILYELHLGTFTPEGTWNAARAQLKELAAIGITAIELMPVAEFSGRWGWGYDGVNLFAPYHHYGSPDEAKKFIDDAHGLGLGIVLDVVYNHFGPDGNYIKSFADEYFTGKYKNDWGEAINFSSAPVRDFYLANAAYWIEEFHFDGLRLDATQDIHDTSDEHILAAITKRIRKAAGKRKVYVVAENEPQHSFIAHPTEGDAGKAGGQGIDALWNDDFHHSAIVALTGRREAYYTDYHGSPQEFISAAKYGYLYQGQRYKWQQKRRGAPAFDLNPWNFVTYLQNHDQVANSARGERPNKLAGPALYRAMSAMLMLGPSTPMLFQGQEFGATTPFLYFCDHTGNLSDMVHTGRGKFLAQFRSLAQSEMRDVFASPGSPITFESSKLNLNERESNAQAYSLYKDLIGLRRKDPVLSNPRPGGTDGAVLSAGALVLRYFGPENNDRLLIVNLGPDLHLDPAPEPLLAPPRDHHWNVLWSSEDPKYGGTGTFPPDSDDNWRIAGHSTLVIAPVEDPEQEEEIE
jgi:maltooligosyltrehalose trehalohydrolase